MATNRMAAIRQAQAVEALNDRLASIEAKLDYLIAELEAAKAAAEAAKAGEGEKLQEAPPAVEVQAAVEPAPTSRKRK